MQHTVVHGVLGSSLEASLGLIDLVSRGVDPYLPQVDPQGLEEALRFWTSSKDSRATLVFDKFVRPHVNPVSHCC